MTVFGLSAALGGRGEGDVVAFTYGRDTDTVVLNANAASLNTLGLDPARGLFVLGFALHANTTGRGVLRLPAPRLEVGTIPVQAVTTIGGGQAHFTSTAAITIVP